MVITIYDRSKQIENVEYFSYLGTMITNEGRYTGEIIPYPANVENRVNS
jgi:hypothetical protein